MGENSSIVDESGELEFINSAVAFRVVELPLFLALNSGAH